MPTIMPNVTRSRRSCRNSFVTIAHQRCDREPDGAATAVITPSASPLAEVVGRALHQVDEHVLEPGVDALDRRSRRRPWLRAACARAARASLAGRRAPSRRTRPSARRRACVRSFSASALRSGPRTANVVRCCAAIDLGGRALHEQTAVRDVRELVAALGLVHVVRADEHRDALRGEPMQLFPEFAPRVRVDAGGRLVEQQQARPMQHARGERQPLLPAAGERAGELVLRGREAEVLERAVDRRRAGRSSRTRAP